MAVQFRVVSFNPDREGTQSWSGCVTLLKSQHRPPKIRLSTGVQLSDCPKHSATTTCISAVSFKNWEDGTIIRTTPASSTLVPFADRGVQIDRQRGPTQARVGDQAQVVATGLDIKRVEA